MLSASPRPECFLSTVPSTASPGPAKLPSSGRSSAICMELFDFLGSQSPAPGDPHNTAHTTRPLATHHHHRGGGRASTSMSMSNVTMDDIAELEATLFYGSDASSEYDEAPSLFRTPTLLDSGLKEDHFFGPSGPSCDTSASSAGSLSSSSASPSSRRGSGAASASAFLNPNKAPPPITSSPKHNKRPKHNPRSRSQSRAGSSSAMPLLPPAAATKASPASRAPRSGGGGPRATPPLPISNLAQNLLPKVDRPELGDLNGKMPRPIIVNTAPRRRRKNDKVTASELAKDEERRKMKSVQSARDCRRRKKQYIVGLQTAIAQYDKREAVAQKLIASLRAQITKINRTA